MTLRDLLTRRLPPSVPTLLLALLATAGDALLGCAMLPAAGWRPLGARECAALGAAAVCIAGAYVGTVVTMRCGRAAVVQPARYTMLLWAAALGYAMFGEQPDRWTIFGSALIVGAGIGALGTRRGAEGGARAWVQQLECTSSTEAAAPPDKTDK